jgi:hypothetical protein
MVAVSTVSPGQTMAWNGQKADARQNLMGSKAGNLYQQQLSGLQYGQRLGDMQSKFNQARVQLPTQYAQRGILQSGIYKNALAQYAQERLRAQNSLQTQFQMEQGGFIFGDRQAEDDYAAALQRILGEQYGGQATAATNIGGW